MAATFWADSLLATIALTSLNVGNALGAAPSTPYTLAHIRKAHLTPFSHGLVSSRAHLPHHGPDGVAVSPMSDLKRS